MHAYEQYSTQTLLVEISDTGDTDRKCFQIQSFDSKRISKVFLHLVFVKKNKVLMKSSEAFFTGPK